MKIKNKLLALGIAGLALTGGLAGLQLASGKCANDEVTLEFQKDETKLCIDKDDYKVLKSRLKQQYEAKSKGYDFEIGDREMLVAVLNNEIKEKGISLRGANKENIKSALINLLTE